MKIWNGDLGTNPAPTRRKKSEPGLVLLLIALDDAINRISAYRFTRKIEMALRLSEKLALAGAVAARQHQKIEQRADNIIAREAEIERKTDQAFLPHEATLDETERGLDQLERQLAVLTNGPPLDESQPGSLDEPADPGPPQVARPTSAYPYRSK